MSDPYQKVKIGKLTFKGGDSIDKKKKRRRKKKSKDVVEDEVVADGVPGPEEEEEEGGGEDFYTIDAAKKMKYEDLFPVEAKKFGYDPKNVEKKSAGETVEGRLDDRVKKKADRYCK